MNCAHCGKPGDTGGCNYPIKIMPKNCMKRIVPDILRRAQATRVVEAERKRVIARAEGTDD